MHIEGPLFSHHLRRVPSVSSCCISVQCCERLIRAVTTFITARRYASTVLAVIVCLSVRLSVTSRSCTKMAKPMITLTTPYDSPETLVFRRQKYRRNSNDSTPTGAPNRGGVGSHRRSSTNISLDLRNGAR